MKRGHNMKKEVIAIQLGNRQYLDFADVIGRKFIGYEPSMTDDEIYEAGRGIWSISASRVFKANHVFITDNEGTVLIEINVTSIHLAYPQDSKHKFIEGTVVKDSEFVGQTLPVNTSRNRINYLKL